MRVPDADYGNAESGDVERISDVLGPLLDWYADRCPDDLTSRKLRQIARLCSVHELVRCLHHRAVTATRRAR